MSTMQRMTLIGLYNYDSTLFDEVVLPDGYDKQTFIDALLMEHGEKCVLYTVPDFMKFSLGVVSRKWALELTRIYEALTAEYNPIYNYDRFEVGKDVRNIKGTNTVSANYDSKRTPDTTRAEEVVTPEITTHDVSAFNASGYQADDKTTRSQGKTEITETGTDNVNVSGKLSDSDVKTRDAFKHDLHVYGNIGVTTSAHMVDEVVTQRMSKNLYDCATRIFANELLIQIY